MGTCYRCSKNDLRRSVFISLCALLFDAMFIAHNWALATNVVRIDLNDLFLFHYVHYYIYCYVYYPISAHATNVVRIDLKRSVSISSCFFPKFGNCYWCSKNWSKTICFSVSIISCAFAIYCYDHCPYRVRREKLYNATKHLFSGSVKVFSTHPVFGHLLQMYKYIY